MVLIDKKRLDYHLALGSTIPDFSLPSTLGGVRSAAHFKEDILVIVFSCNHCPYVHASEHALQALVEQFKGKVDFVAINSNEDTNYPDDSFANMKRKKVNYAYLRDESQEIARAFGAECTPHVFVFGKDRTLIYQGRIDDAGSGASQASTHELRDAIEDALAAKKVRVPLTSAMGCSIKWK